MNFGEKLIEVRKAKGLTQDEVAEMCNITTRTVQRIESGAVIPRAFTIKTISEALGFDFFETSNTGCGVSKENHHSGLKWYIKDLFNLKTKTMKKLSILTVSFLMIGFAVFALTTRESSNVQTQQTRPNFINTESSIEITDTLTLDELRRIQGRLRNQTLFALMGIQTHQPRPNFINTENLVEVAFTNAFTLDSLVRIQNELAKREISIHYKQLEFDISGHLTSIMAVINTNDGVGGGFYVSGLNSYNKYARHGFFRSFCETDGITFGAGLLRGSDSE